MKLSTHITTLLPGGDDGWGLFDRARQMADAGEHVTELTIGEHDIRTHPDILNAMHRAAMSGHTGYARVPGVAALRDAVAARVQARTGVPTTRENVVITTGGQAALFAAHIAVLDTGDAAAYVDPYYATYPGTIRGAGGVLRPIPTHARDAFQPTKAALDTALVGAKSLLVNTPNNPTGVVYTPDTIRTIAQAVIQHDCWLISDEVYDTQIWDGAHISPRALPDMAERTLVIGSMSKSHAMTGSRVGWVVGPSEAIAHMITLATHTTYGVPGYIQDAALFALNQGAPLETEVAAPFARRRQIALDLIEAQNVVRAVPNGGAMYMMLDIRATGLTGAAFADALLDTHKIAVMPGESFGSSAAGHVRVAMTVDDAAFATAFKTLLDYAATLVKGP